MLFQKCGEDDATSHVMDFLVEDYGKSCSAMILNSCASFEKDYCLKLILSKRSVLYSDEYREVRPMDALLRIFSGRMSKKQDFGKISQRDGPKYSENVEMLSG